MYVQMNITPKKWASYTKGNNLLYPQRCLLYLRDGPPTPTEGFPVSIEEAFYAYRRLPMSTESLMCPQMASYARRLPCLTGSGSSFSYRGPPLPTGDLLYQQRGLLYPEGTRMPMKGSLLHTEGPPLITEGGAMGLFTYRWPTTST